MTLKALTIVVLRLFAIRYFIEALVAALAVLPAQYVYLDVNRVLSELFYPASLLILAGVLWLVARHLAAIVTKGIDGPLPFTALTREDIYCCAFVILGLDFVLGSISAALLELYQYTQIYSHGGYPANGWSQYTIPLVKHTLTLIAGTACILGAQAWTRKLLRLEQKNETQNESDET